MNNQVTHKLPRPMICDLCHSSEIQLTSHEELYGKNYGDWPLVYLCRNCGASVGVHKQTNSPLGYMADKRTRQARKRLHDVFDVLWKRQNWLSRSDAYTWLSWNMGVALEDCHISRFTRDQCEKAINMCTGNPPTINEFNPRKG